ncbi:MAG: trigger factor [Eubacterium sp.]|nr:trigger factor [Eubacterium sp.]
MMKKKLFGSILTGVLCLGLLAGCGTSGNPAEVLKERYGREVDLGTYKGIEYTQTKTEVTDSNVETRLSQWVMGFGETVKKTEGTAESGDTVGIDYVGRVDGVEFEGGSTKGAGTEITLGSSGYVAGFDDQIVGHKPGETFEVKVTFPENYGKEELNGKPAVFETTLNYISKMEYPELTDELVAEKTEYKTIDEYRKHLREDMEKTQAEEDKEKDIETMMTQITDTSAVKSYPEKEMKDQIAKLTSQIESTATSYGVELNQLLMMYGYTADSFQEEIRDGVESYIKRKMIVGAIAQKEDITVSKQEAEEKTRELLKASGLNDVETLNSRYGYSNDDYYYVVLEDKVLNFIYDNAVPKEASETEGTTTDSSATEAVTEAATEAVTEAVTEAATE